MIITEKMKTDFRSDGAIKLEGLLDENQLEACRNCYEQSLANPSPDALEIFEGSADAHYNDFSNPENLSLYEQVIEKGRFGEVLSEIWGSEHVWFLGEELFRKDGGQAGRSPWHQDTAYVPIEGDDLANFWISFEALPQQNSLEVVKGSHRGQQYDGSSFSDPQNHTKPMWGEASFPQLPDIEWERRADPNSWEILSWSLEPGDATLLHSGCLHGGAPVDAFCSTRNTLVLRFFGDRVRYRPLPGHRPDYFMDVRTVYDDSMEPGERFRSPTFLQIK